MQSFDTIISRLTENDNTLTNLTLKACELKPNILLAFATALQNNNTLTELNIQVSREEAASKSWLNALSTLSTALQKNYTLLSFNLKPKVGPFSPSEKGNFLPNTMRKRKSIVRSSHERFSIKQNSPFALFRAELDDSRLRLQQNTLTLFKTIQPHIALLPYEPELDESNLAPEITIPLQAEADARALANIPPDSPLHSSSNLLKEINTIQTKLASITSSSSLAFRSFKKMTWLDIVPYSERRIHWLVVRNNQLKMLTESFIVQLSTGNFISIEADQNRLEQLLTLHPDCVGVQQLSDSAKALHQALEAWNQDNTEQMNEALNKLFTLQERTLFAKECLIFFGKKYAEIGHFNNAWPLLSPYIDSDSGIAQILTDLLLSQYDPNTPLLITTPQLSLSSPFPSSSFFGKAATDLSPEIMAKLFPHIDPVSHKALSCTTQAWNNLIIQSRKDSLKLIACISRSTTASDPNMRLLNLLLSGINADDGRIDPKAILTGTQIETIVADLKTQKESLLQRANAQFEQTHHEEFFNTSEMDSIEDLANTMTISSKSF